MILDRVLNTVSQDLKTLLQHHLRRVPLIDIQSVSDHCFIVDPARQWNLRTDFPACFPPPHALWMEFTRHPDTPDPDGTRSDYGVLVVPEVLSQEEALGVQTHWSVTAKWTLSLHAFCPQLPGSFLGIHYVYIASHGAIVMEPDPKGGLWLLVAISDHLLHLRGFPLNRDDLIALIAGGTSTPALLALMLFNTDRATLAPHPQPSRRLTANSTANRIEAEGAYVFQITRPPTAQDPMTAPAQRPTRVDTIPLPKEVQDLLKVHMANFEKQFGRPMGPGDPLIWDLDSPTPQCLTGEAREAFLKEINVYMVKFLKKAGAPPEFIYAYERTGGVVTPINEQFIQPEQRQAWEAACAEYRAMQARV